ncbi:MAG TPA: hypothetical protein VMN03_08400 [Burkholderiales bacterium]|nr:hypothetical protein [Burkholderiales bacterium]
MLGELLQQAEPVPVQAFLDAADDSGIIDRVRESVAAARLAVRQRDLEVELDFLRHLCLPVVDADPDFEAQFADEDDVHQDR